MPPKHSTARGAARGRGRGRGRGGASAAAAESTRPEPTAQPTDTDAGEDSLFVPKDEPMHDAPAPEAASADVSMTEGDAAVLSSETVPEDAADASTSASRPEVSRVSSVRSSATPAATSAAAKKGVARLPTFKGRRSKEERDAMEAEAAAKRRERLTEQAKEQGAAGRGRGDRGRGRGRGSDRGGRGGRGGYMGQQGGSGGGGIFSEGVVHKDPRHKMIHRGKTFGAGGPSGVKREPRVKGEAEESGFGTRDEAEDGGYISSDPEIETLGPRKDVDSINLISDEETEEGGDEAGLSFARRKETYNAPELAPVRIQRKEHENRAVGITAEAPGQNNIKIEDDVTSPRKTKIKAKDVEIVGSKEQWKGAWGWKEEADGVIRIKDEPTDENEPMAIPAADITADAEQPAAIKDAPSSPELSRRTKPKPKPRHKSRFRAPTAIVTEEDRLEEERHHQNMDILRDELGDVVITPQQAEVTAAADAEGDTAMKDDAHQAEDKKEDRVYLFQLPPVIPSLHIDDSTKQEPTSPSKSRTMIDLSTPEVHSNTPVKTEDGDANDALNSAHPDLPATLASGVAGKLRVHASGRATLDWGGTSLELKMGTEAHFLQDIIITRLHTEEERGQARVGGEALAFGQVRGKFVVTPDWDEIVG